MSDGGGAIDAAEVHRLATDLREIAERLSRMEEKLDQRFVPRELYEARHTSLRSEIALELAAMRQQQTTDRAVAAAAKALSMWAVGLIASAVVVALVGFLATGGPQP